MRAGLRAKLFALVFLLGVVPMIAVGLAMYVLFAVAG